MRLTLFNRIRRLVRPRRFQATGTVSQGRHRRDQRLVPGPEQEAQLTSQSLSPLTRTAASAPEGWPAPGTPLVRDAQPVPARRASGSPAVRTGGARARIREAPGEAAASVSRRDWREAATQPPAELVAELAADPGAQAEALARAAAGIPHQAGAAGIEPLDKGVEAGLLLALVLDHRRAHAVGDRCSRATRHLPFGRHATDHRLLRLHRWQRALRAARLEPADVGRCRLHDRTAVRRRDLASSPVGLRQLRRPGRPPRRSWQAGAAHAGCASVRQSRRNSPVRSRCPRALARQPRQAAG